ncbi:MAG: NTP transferase domain-containing protein [Rhodospirillaceae bacterium]
MTIAAASRRPVVALIQARMGSDRFPGKMMADLCGFPVIHWVLKRVAMARRLDKVVLTTSAKKRDDALVDVAAALGLESYRYEPEDDVLGRFAAAARATGAASVVRVCADGPLVDADVVDHAVAAFLEADADYAFNHIPRLDGRYPDGLGAEVASEELIYQLDREALTPFNREAPFSYIWQHPGRFRIHAVDCPPEWDNRGADIRLDIDWPADLARMNTLCRDLTMAAPAADILARWRTLYADFDGDLYPERSLRPAATAVAANF